MRNFYDDMPLEDAEHIQTLARLRFELRENHKLLLDEHGVADEAGLLERIVSGGIDEHPAYERYLSAKILSGTMEAIRQELKTYLQEMSKS